VLVIEACIAHQRVIVLAHSLLAHARLSGCGWSAMIGSRRTACAFPYDAHSQAVQAGGGLCRVCPDYSMIYWVFC
jgi:hypothetical protein